jgi:hypothetical protein
VECVILTPCRPSLRLLGGSPPLKGVNDIDALQKGRAGHQPQAGGGRRSGLELSSRYLKGKPPVCVCAMFPFALLCMFNWNAVSSYNYHTNV